MRKSALTFVTVTTLAVLVGWLSTSSRTMLAGTPPAAAPSSGSGGSKSPAAAPKPATPADNSYCLVCHTNYEEEKLTMAHQPVGVGCEKCHGASVKHSGDEDGLTPPEIMYPKADVSRFCMTCHPKQELLHGDNHKELYKDGDYTGACTDCHGKKHRLKVRTRIWTRRLASCFPTMACE